MKLKYKKKKNTVMVTIKLPKDAVINLNQYDTLAKSNRLSLAKLESVKKNKLAYSISNVVTLSEHLKTEIGKDECIYIIEQIIEIYQVINECGLSDSNLLMSDSEIFINTSTFELFFVYVPVISVSEKLNIIQCIKQTINQFKLPKQDSSFLIELNKFVKHTKVSDVKEIKIYLEKTKKMDFFTANKNSTASDNNYDDDVTDVMQIDIDNDVTDVMKEMSTIGTAQQNNNSAHISLPTSVTKEGTDDETIYLDDDETLIGNCDYEAQSKDANNVFLKRLSTEETIVIDKPVFRIGKEVGCVDYVVSNNVAISRSHADIISRKGKYYVFDLRSKNKSYVNNRVLPAEKEIEITNGDILKLANEEFVFQTI